jgi:hypothetical protein
MKFADKIYKIASALNLTRKGFAETLGVTERYLEAAISETSNSKKFFQEVITDKFQVNPKWWENTEGSIFLRAEDVMNFSVDEMEFIYRFRNLEEGNREKIHRILEAMDK